MTRYYLDTSIWLDLMEDRNEDMPKGKWARAMFSRIVRNDDTVLVSDVVQEELERLGYTTQMWKRSKPCGPSSNVWTHSQEKSVWRKTSRRYETSRRLMHSTR